MLTMMMVSGGNDQGDDVDDGDGDDDSGRCGHYRC